MLFDTPSDGQAIISPCGMYRYTLHRRVECTLRWVKPVLFVMLNPSTADATKDDPTIRRCISFTKALGGTSLTVVNLFAFRSSSPEALKLAPDPVGPDNDNHIREQIERHSLGIIIAAWGAHKFTLSREFQVYNYGHPKWSCLGKTKGGSPRHPLYVRSNTELQEFKAFNTVR